jgi:hypothetical protein
LLDFTVESDRNTHKGCRGRFDDFIVAGRFPIVARLGKEWVTLNPSDGFWWRHLTGAVGSNGTIAVDRAGQAGLRRDDRPPRAGALAARAYAIKNS